MSALLPTGLFRFIALDVETANRDSASISQIGLACVRQDHQIETYATYVDPECDFAPFNTELTGISAQTVRGAPNFAEIWPQMLPLLSQNLLVQHSTFDQKAIAAACQRFDLPKADLIWANSVTIARKAWPELKGNGGHGLANLKQVLGLEFDHHDAGEDARAAAETVLQAEARLEKSIEDIAKLPKNLQLAFSF